MKKIRKLFVTAFLLFGIWMAISGVRAEAAVNVVLDPGHDATHTGANANGLAEETINFKIARYCMEELQKYAGVNVYMTRNGTGCPYPGTSSTSCNKKRVEFAKSVGANAYVSIHNNAASSSSAKGVSVYYPNANYNSPVGVAGQRLAQTVLNHLTSLGLYNRGTLIRNSEDNSRYPDGSLADYYGVIKNSKLSGFTGIIIEHAFVTSPEDVSGFLSTDEKLKLLGIADATAIAEYYGLSKSWDQDVSKAGFVSSFSSDYKTVSIFLTGVPKAPSVSIAVWSLAGGQDDLVWYDAVKDSNGNWNIEAPLSKHRTEGEYAVHAYVNDKESGQSILAKQTSFLVEGPENGVVTVTDLNEKTGDFKVRVTDVRAKAGISKVMIPIWSGEEQDDLKWYEAGKTADGAYEANVSVSDFDYASGVYNVHAYATDENGIQKLIATCRQTISQPDSRLELDISDYQSVLDVSVSDLPYADDVTAVKAAVWSAEDGQDDLSWHTLEQADGEWRTSLFLTNHLTDGECIVHIYAEMKNGSFVFLKDGAIVPRASETYQYQAQVREDNQLLWNGRVALLEADADAISADAVITTPDAVATTPDAVATTPDAAAITPDAAIVTTNALMCEKTYTFAEHLAIFRQLKEQLEMDQNFYLDGFYLTDVSLQMKDLSQSFSINDTVRLRFKIPQAYAKKDVAVYALEEKDGQILLGAELETTVSEDGFAQVSTEQLGAFAVVVKEEMELYGDVDLDKKITLNDCLIVLRAALRIDELLPVQQKAADVNQNGKIDLGDVSLLLNQALQIVGK